MFSSSNPDDSFLARQERDFETTSLNQMPLIFGKRKQRGNTHRTSTGVNLQQEANSISSYSEDDMTNKITVQHREPKDFSDRVALFMVRMLRWGTDIATGYHHDVEEPSRASDTQAVTKTKPYRMSERKWLIRFIFLESVAGVPGMVAGMLRHLHSIRRLKRDNGWYVKARKPILRPC